MYMITSRIQEYWLARSVIPQPQESDRVSLQKYILNTISPCSLHLLRMKIGTHFYLLVFIERNLVSNRFFTFVDLLMYYHIASPQV